MIQDEYGRMLFKMDKRKTLINCGGHNLYACHKFLKSYDTSKSPSEAVLKGIMEENKKNVRKYSFKARVWFREALFPGNNVKEQCLRAL